MMLDGSARREAILTYLSNHSSPVNGSELAKQFGVSRQVIVQDIALLRATNRDILSTNRGYTIFQSPAERGGVTDVLMVRHSAEQTLDEMLSVVDYGGTLLDVFVDHDLYGQIRADLLICNRVDAEEFCKKMELSNSRPLKELTGDYHYHTIKAPSEKALTLIKEELREKGFLIS